MAVFEAKNLHNGSEMVASIQDTRRSYFRSVAWASAIDGDLNNGVLATLAGIPTTAQVGTSVVPLDSISATYISNSTAMLAAVYRYNTGTARCGTNRVTLTAGYESIQWWYGAPSDSDFDANGLPNGVELKLPDAAGGKLSAPHRIVIPVWNLDVSTVLNYNPAESIKGYLRYRTNSDNITWDGFSLGANQVRFNGARIDYRGSKYFVDYSFTLRKLWIHQVWDPSSDAPQSAFMYASTTFAGGFPVGANEGGC